VRLIWVRAQLLLPHAQALSFLEWPGFWGFFSPYPTHKELALEPLSFLKAKSVMTSWNMGCITHRGLAIYIKKFLKAKRRITETQIFHHAKI